jgi:DNA polymerase III delta prime subunit
LSGAFLIAGGNYDQRVGESEKILRAAELALGENNPDIIRLAPEKDSLGVEEIRRLQGIISRKPFSSPMQAALILQAEKLTVEAQNALLKILEEPPEQTIIVLTAPDESLLLPTVVSRCQLVFLSGLRNLSVLTPSPETTQVFTWISEGNIPAGFAWAEKIKDRAAALALLDQLIASARPSLLASQGHALRIIKNLLRAKKYLQANTNLRLTLENLFI